MKFIKEWNNYEETTMKVYKAFARWEKKNLIVLNNKRDRNIEYTYGLPYTSSSAFAMISNTNCKAEYIHNRNLHFEYIAITEENKIVVALWDAEENETFIIIGTL